MPKTSSDRARELADLAAGKLLGYCCHGLPSCYVDFEESLYDFYPDLPWDAEGCKVAMQHLLDKHGPTLDLVQQKFGFDMKADIEKGIQEI